jgi:hypothetical protein
MKRVAAVVAMVLLGSSAVFAQQMYSPGPGYYGYGQAAPPAYGQPQYAQPQPYGQPQYAQPQPYGQPQYAQPQPYGQPYAQQPYQQAYPQQGYSQQQPYGQPQYQAPYPLQQPAYGQGYGQAQAGGQALNADQIEQMVAPIALDPDTLVAQVLAASTYPAQVQDADRWLQAQGNASPYQIAGGADVQNWDPSVKGLTAFPQVLQEMDRNIQWTAALGNAYYNQPQDVLEAVQVLRQRAQAAGNLQSTPQEQVSYDQGAIELAPPSPQMVYVPQYNPWTVYGDPVTPYPGFNLLSAVGSFFTSALGSSPLQWGLGIAMGAFEHTPFGLLSWAVNWLADGILFNHSNYYSHSTTVANWGLPRGGMLAYAGRGGDGVGRGGYGGGGGVARPWEGGNRYAATPNRGYSVPSAGYRQGSMEAYNRAPAPISRPQTYSRPESRLAYGPEAYGGSARSYSASEAYRGQASQTYRAPTMQANRGPSESFQSGGFGGRGSESYKEPKSSGFHLFGSGSKEPRSYAQNSFKEPKFSAPKYSAPKFSAPKAPKMSGGSKGFSGGHSSGHSSGHHW